MEKFMKNFIICGGIQHPGNKMISIDKHDAYTSWRNENVTIFT